MQKFISVAERNDVPARMTDPQKCDTHVEHMDVWADYQGVAGHHFDSLR